MAIKAAFVSQKGGTGKSTSCILTANNLSQDPFNWNLAILDADPQQSIYDARAYDLDKYDRKPPYVVHSAKRSEILPKLADLDETNDLVLIDTGGKLDTHLPAEHQETLTVIDAADMLFIPVHIGRLSLLSTFRFIDELSQYIEKLQDPPAVYLYPSIYSERLNASYHTKNVLQEIEQETGMHALYIGLKQYSLFMDIDTYKSLYSPNSNDAGIVNATAFTDAIADTIKRI